MTIKDRIIEFRRVPASQLLPSPKNWRTHSTEQADALRGVLAEVGFAGAVLARETPDGLMLIDGHLRSTVATDQEIPCLVLDVTEAEADKLLATYDPISSMAGADPDALANLLDSIETDSDALHRMLEGMKDQHGLVLDEGREFDESAADDVKQITCPHCGKDFPL
jgi:hypothetical protein